MRQLGLRRTLRRRTEVKHEQPARSFRRAAWPTNQVRSNTCETVQRSNTSSERDMDGKFETEPEERGALVVNKTKEPDRLIRHR